MGTHRNPTQDRTITGTTEHNRYAFIIIIIIIIIVIIIIVIVIIVVVVVIIIIIVVIIIVIIVVVTIIIIIITIILGVQEELAISLLLPGVKFPGTKKSLAWELWSAPLVFEDLPPMMHGTIMLTCGLRLLWI